jgi:hypothetical protein
MQQGDEDLGLGLLVGGDGIADDAGAARVAVLVAQAFVDASCGVASLGRGEAVVVEDLVDDGQEGPQDGLGPWCGTAKGGRLGLGDDLLDGAEVEVVFGGCLPQAQLAGEDAATDFGPDAHVGEHSCLPLSGPKAALSLTGWRSGALHFSVGTALHFFVGKHTWVDSRRRKPRCA